MRCTLIVEHVLGGYDEEFSRVLQHESSSDPMVGVVLVVVLTAENHRMNMALHHVNKLC
ncbi:hypothetical protein D3C72_2527100 [compost metagenome]